MKVILAQGNPEPRFDGTRHNIGFYMLDKFAAHHGGEWSAKPKFRAGIAEINLAGEKVLLVKPATFYNETGLAARALVDFYKLDPSRDVLVIHDDFALPLGTIRVREKGSDAGNNGIKSLNTHLGETYHRLRIGIWNEQRNQLHDVDFVLSKFSASERKILDESVTPKVDELIADFARDSLQLTSYKLA